MPTPRPTKLSEIIPYLMTQLQVISGFPPERVLLDQRDDNELEAAPSQADQFYVFRVMGGSPTDNEYGSGRLNTWQVRIIKVTIWSRLALDEPGRDLIWLTDPSLSHLDFEHVIWDALQEFQPTDPQGNWLVVEPLHGQTAESPKKGKVDHFWGRSGVNWRVNYILALDQSRQ